MKKILLPLGLCALLGFGSCSEDFEVSAPYKSYTVVYGILDPSDTAHYLRIQKAFLDESKSAIDLAKLPDSSYFSNLNVTVQAYENNNPKGGAIAATRVNMEAEGYTKNQPLNVQGFFTAPTYAYKFKADLNPFYTYRVTINNPITGTTLTSDIETVSNDPDLQQKNLGFYVPSFNKDTVQLAFERTTAVSKLSAGGSTVGGNIPKNAAIFEGLLRFHYVDKNIVTGAETPKSIDYHLTTFENKGANFILPTANTAIYSFLRDEMGPAPGNIERRMGFVEIHLFAGNQDMAVYSQVNNSQGGLTGDQIKPIYTNINGPNALGLIGSRAHRAHYQGFITNNTLDSLKINPLTAPLKIAGRTN